MLSCKNYKGSWRDKEYTTICEEAISLANKMLDLEYEPNLIHCTLSNANGSGTHDSMKLTALTKYIECYPQIDKRKIGDLALGLNKEKIDFLNKVLELKINNKISLSESELELLMRFGSEIQGSSNFIIKSLETGKTPSKIIENLAYFQNLHNDDSNTKVVLKSLITSEKLFNDPTALLIVRNYLDKPYMRESREQILSMIKSMIEDNSFSTKQLKDTVNIGKYGIGLQYIENREYLTGCGKSEIDVFAENTKELISELYNEDSIPKELLNPNKIYSKLKTESKETIIHKIKNFANQHSETIEKIEATKQKMLEHPQLYINGEISTLEAQKNKILDWFYQYYEAIIPLFDALDKESIDYLMRLRLDNAEEYLDTVSDYFKKEDIELLKNLIQSHDINGEQLKPKQKVEMIDLIEAYNDNELSTDIISNMVKEDKVDIEKLQLHLFYEIMVNAGMSENEIANIPKEKLIAWDTKFSHLLSKDINETEDESFEDIIRAANLDDFRRYIHDTSNKYGRTNEITQNKFKQANMSYEKWLNPSKENEVEFVATDENMEQLNHMVSDIAENMNVLLQTPAKGFIIKQFNDFVKDDKFVLPKEYLSSKAKIKDLLQKLTNESEEGQLYQIWKRAKDNSTCGVAERETRARGTLTVLEHLKQKLSDIDKIKLNNGSKTLALKIKMWDRVPQKDLFQGNYSTCCIGIGRGNGCYMPHYLMDTAFNMIELTNSSGKIIGNALCYFVTQSNGEVAFIIDNIEISDAEKPSKEIQIQLRDAITKYADNVVKEVTGKSDVPIYISSHWNDVDVKDLPKSRDIVSFIGDIDCDEIYLDLYHDGDCNEVSKKNLTRDNELLQLK